MGYNPYNILQLYSEISATYVYFLVQRREWMGCWGLLGSLHRRDVWIIPYVKRTSKSTVWLVVFRHPSEKYEFVNWDDDINPILLGKFKIHGNQLPPTTSESSDPCSFPPSLSSSSALPLLEFRGDALGLRNAGAFHDQPGARHLGLPSGRPKEFLEEAQYRTVFPTPVR